jgi:hypothetical protein
MYLNVCKNLYLIDVNTRPCLSKGQIAGIAHSLQAASHN